MRCRLDWTTGSRKAR